MHVLKLHLLLLCLFILISFHASAQFQNPPGIDWKKIDTEHFEVIFPPEITRDAQRVANTLEYVYEPVAKTLAEKPGKISVLLSNRTAQATKEPVPQLNMSLRTAKRPSRDKRFQF